ncbi:hypothetical protein R5R35_003255 [Gryllus longicercus]|uniref:Enoyl reductase (ER) domain-containing protein n=1 Tax=Gryllus longicercus TaxID=2509291 RepID=A0AAN9Z900_9ORTH
MDALQFDLKSKQLSLIQLPVPSKLAENDVLIKVAYAGICGTDLHIAEGAFPCGEKVVLGHEFSGVVEAVGSKVNHVKPGDKVSVDPNSGCGTCNYCTDSNYHYCEVGGLNNTIGIYRNGGWANYCVVPNNQVFKLPEKISLEQAALTEPLSCISHGWDKIQPIPIGKDILIMGAGIIGNLWACVLHLQGHRKVIVSEPQEARRKLVANLNTGYEIMKPTDLQARKAANPKWGVDLIIDCSGFGPAIEQALDLLNPGGQLCIFGVASPETKISVSPYLLFKKELTINAINVNPFSFNKSLGFIDAMGDRYLAYEKLGIKVFGLNQYEAALAALKTGTIAKAIFKID